MPEFSKNKPEGWIEPIDHEKIMARLKWEDDILIKPLSEQSLYELETVRDILKRRMEENQKLIDSGIDLLNVNVPSELDNQIEGVMGDTHKVVNMVEEKNKKYLEDLLIIEGLIKKKEGESEQ